MRVSNGRELLWCAEHETPAILHPDGSHSCDGECTRKSCRLVPVEGAEVPMDSRVLELEEKVRLAEKLADRALAARNAMWDARIFREADALAIALHHYRAAGQDQDDVLS